jgi:hypothetical protein
MFAMVTSRDNRGLDQLHRTAQQQRVAQLRKLQQMQNQYEVQAATVAQRDAKQTAQDARMLSQREHQRRLAARQAAGAAAVQVLYVCSCRLHLIEAEQAGCAA